MSYNDDSRRREDERRAQQQRDDQQRQRDETRRADDQRRAEDLQRQRDAQRRADDQQRQRDEQRRAEDQRSREAADRAASDRLSADNARKDADTKKFFNQKDRDAKEFYDQKSDRKKAYYNKNDDDRRNDAIEQRGREAYAATKAGEAKRDEQQRSSQAEDAEYRRRLVAADDEARRRKQSGSSGTSGLNSPNLGISRTSVPAVPCYVPTSSPPPPSPRRVNTPSVSRGVEPEPFRGNAAPAPVRVGRALFIIVLAACAAAAFWYFRPGVAPVVPLLGSVPTKSEPTWSTPMVRALFLGQVHTPMAQYQLANALSSGGGGVASNRCLAAYFYKKFLDNPASKGTLTGEYGLAKQAYDASVRRKSVCRVVIHADKSAATLADLVELKGQPVNAVSDAFVGLSGS